MVPTVAVLNSNQDVVEMLRLVIEREGFNTVSAHVPDIKRGSEDFLGFLKQHDPGVIVYDITPPYRENWNFLKMILDLDSVKDRKFVLTTANLDLLKSAAGRDADAFEISEKPYSLEAIVKAVRAAAGGDL